MSRRRIAAVFATLFVAVTAFAASADSQPASAADDAASVNGDSISVDDFEDVLVLAGEGLPDYAVDELTGTVTAASVRDVLGLMILNRAEHQFLRRHGMSEPSDEARQDAEASLDQGGTSWATGALRDELINGAVYAAQLDNVAVPDVESLRARYESSPLAVGALCARRIPVASPDEGDAVIEALAAGDDPAAGIDVTCVSRTSVRVTSLDVQPGEAIGPLPSQDGSTAVYVVAGFDESIDALTDLFEGAEAAGTTPGELLFVGWLVTADITVNPRYGRWDSTSAGIVPLGQP